MEVSDGIANVLPIVEVVGDRNKETTQSNSNNADTNPNEDTTSQVEEEIEVNNNASQESYQQNKETQQSNSNNADKNSYSGIPSNVEEEEVGDKNKASHESNSNTSPKDLEGSGNNADTNPITNTNTGDKSAEGHDSNNNSNSKEVVDVDSMPASKNIEVSDGIASVPPIVEEVGDQHKETT